MHTLQVQHVQLRRQAGVTTLVDETDEIRLQLFTSAHAATPIHAALHGHAPTRSLPHEILHQTLAALQATMRQVVITELREGSITARLELGSAAGELLAADAQAIDAVAIALRAGLPILATSQVLETMGVKQGQMIDVDGYRLSAHRHGSGSPTVIFESGHGSSHKAWGAIPQAIAREATVVSYDRAGLGWSDYDPAPRTTADTARDLCRLLERLDVPAPYVFVGHSMGGQLARLFDYHYPGRVAGMVFVDSVHPEQELRFAAALPPESIDEQPGLRQYRQGVIGDFGSPEWNSISAAIDAGRICGGLGDRPLVVLTAGRYNNVFAMPDDIVEQQFEVWCTMQQELARLSSDSEHWIAEASGHFIQREQPGLVVEAILHVLERVRRRT